MKYTSVFSIVLLNTLSLMGSEQSNQNEYFAQSEVIFEFSEVSSSPEDIRQRAVAFHSITFIDSVAYPISEIVFGTTEANNLQISGWFGNEASSEVGSMQWAGGTTKQAGLNIAIPVHAEGFLLKILSVKDSLWMNVTIDGEQIAKLRVDAFWHSGFVPVGDHQPESIPASEPAWPDGEIFPHFPLADRIYVFPAKTILDNHEVSWVPEWRINTSYETMMSLTLVGMQGIINRYKPRVYLDYCGNTGVSRYWLPYLEEHVEVLEMDLDHLSTLNFLIKKYGSHFAGIVVYDPEIPATINLATMIAGLEDRIILAPEQLDLPGLTDFTSVTDLRLLVQEQGWDTSETGKYHMYQWVYDSLWQDLEHRIIGAISPGPPTSQSHGYGGFFPLGLAQRDYYVALKLSALYLDPRDSLQAQLYRKFLDDAPTPIPITSSSPGELDAGALIAEYGNVMPGIAAPNAPLSQGNLTVISGVRPEIQVYQPDIDNNRILSTLGNKPVATLWCTDGDNLQFQIDRGFHGGPDWVWEKVQGYRYGWTTNPTLASITPIIWNYYIDSRDKVELVCGFSGAGYTYPRLMVESKLQAYLDLTAAYLNMTGLRTVWVWTETWNDKLAQMYYAGLEHTGYLGAFYGLGSRWGLPFSYNGVPTPGIRRIYSVEPSSIDQVVSDIVSLNTDSICIKLNSRYPYHSGTVVQDTDAVDGEAAFYAGTSDAYHEIITGPFINLAPGDYTVAMRLKVADNQGSQDFLNIAVSSPRLRGLDAKIEGFDEFASRKISLDEFDQSNAYELISFPVTLEKFTTYIEIIVSQINGVNVDITADYIMITKNDPDGLPVYATVSIDLLSAEKQTDTPKIFTEKFENEGGIILTPDEFVSSLNPAFMIDLAESRLGSGNANVIKAKGQFSAGSYYESLLTIRNVLKTTVSMGKPPLFDHIELSQNYPNPFNSTTAITFTLQSAEKVKIEVYSALGQKITTILDRTMPAGKHKIEFDGHYLTSGIYFLKIKTLQFQAVRKMIKI